MFDIIIISTPECANLRLLTFAFCLAWAVHSSIVGPWSAGQAQLALWTTVSFSDQHCSKAQVHPAGDTL